MHFKIFINIALGIFVNKKYIFTNASNFLEPVQYDWAIIKHAITANIVDVSH